MSKKTYIGVNNVARKIKKTYIGIDNIARKIKKTYIGVNNIAELVYIDEDLLIPFTVTKNNRNQIGYTGAANENLIIPEMLELNGVYYSVTEIDNDVDDDDGVFEKCNNLNSIVFPDSITTVGRFAFSNCDNLKTITFGLNSKLRHIGVDAFAYCDNLSNVVLPQGVTRIDVYAFGDCHSLTDIQFGGTVSQWNALNYTDFENTCTIHCSDGAVIVEGNYIEEE